MENHVFSIALIALGMVMGLWREYATPAIVFWTVYLASLLTFSAMVYRSVFEFSIQIRRITTRRSLYQFEFSGILHFANTVNPLYLERVGGCSQVPFKVLIKLRLHVPHMSTPVDGR